MKFILSFLIVTTALSASTCFKLSVGNAALTPEILCSQNNTFTPVAPIDCKPVTLQIPTQNTIKCDLPTSTPTPTLDLSKCTPAPIICPPVVSPIPPPASNCNPEPNPKTTSAVPEPASYALLGAGLMTAGVARRLRKKAQ
jgi:hypothetical protein